MLRSSTALGRLPVDVLVNREPNAHYSGKQAASAKSVWRFKRRDPDLGLSTFALLLSQRPRPRSSSALRYFPGARRDAIGGRCFFTSPRRRGADHRDRLRVSRSDPVR